MKRLFSVEVLKILDFYPSCKSSKCKTISLSLEFSLFSWFTLHFGQRAVRALKPIQNTQKPAHARALEKLGEMNTVLIQCYWLKRVSMLYRSMRPIKCWNMRYGSDGHAVKSPALTHGVRFISFFIFSFFILCFTSNSANSLFFHLSSASRL